MRCRRCLAKRKGSPRLIDLSEVVLTEVLADTDLVERLEEMEDFRNLRLDVRHQYHRPVEEAAGGQDVQDGQLPGP